jgi:hypothetical protein
MPTRDNWSPLNSRMCQSLGNVWSFGLCNSFKTILQYRTHHQGEVNKHVHIIRIASTAWLLGHSLIKPCSKAQPNIPGQVYLPSSSWASKDTSSDLAYDKLVIPISTSSALPLTPVWTRKGLEVQVRASKTFRKAVDGHQTTRISRSSTRLEISVR